MNTEELAIIRAELVNGNTKPLKDFYLSYREDCRNVLLSKNLSDIDGADDIFSDAIIILRKNLISGKIQVLTSVRSYLISTCINLARKKIQYKTRTQNKMNEVRLLFYKNNDTTVDEVENKSELIEISKRAFSSLTDRCQKIIEGYYIHKLSMREIAENLELSSSDVAKTLKSRCYKYLLEEVKKIRAKS